MTIKYKLSVDYEKLENHHSNHGDFWRWASEFCTIAIYKTLKDKNNNGIVSSLSEHYLYTIDRPTNKQFFELYSMGIYLEEIDRRQEVKDQIVSKLADELNNIVRHKQFDDISNKLFSVISDIKAW